MDDYARLKQYRKQIDEYLNFVDNLVEKIRSKEVGKVDGVLPALADALAAAATECRREIKERESEVQANGAMTEDTLNRLGVATFKVYRLDAAVRREKAAYDGDRADFIKKFGFSG